jgi:hypothetical protein
MPIPHVGHQRSRPRRLAGVRGQTAPPCTLVGARTKQTGRAVKAAEVGGRRRRPAALSAAALGMVLALTGCGGTTNPPPTSSPASSAATPSRPPTSPTNATTPAGYSKILLIAEENHTYEQIIGNPRAPYTNQLASRYGTATRMDAGYPPGCPSLAAYILMTSGTTAGICDDRAPKGHRLDGDNLFQQVAASGREWRN